MALAEDLELRIHVPISELQPSVDTKNCCIRGIVTLIWPYSSSKGSLSLLLAEPDFRLRRQKGQIRVTFTGSSAKLVARSGVTSGDGLVLGMVGVEWAKDETTLSTPGKGSEWELGFGERALLHIDPESKTPVSLNIDHPTLSPEPQIQSSTPPRSPTTPESPWVSNHRASGRAEPQVWSSPAFLKRGCLSSAPYLNSIYDPFLEEDGYLEGIGRKRTKFGRESGQWRYTERTPSPDRESEAEVHKDNQHGPLGPTNEGTETTTVLEENSDLQESKKDKRGTDPGHEFSLPTPAEGRTSDIDMIDDDLIAEYATAEKESSMITVPEDHAVEGPGVSVSQQVLPTGLPVNQRSSSAERSPIAREKLLTIGGAERIVAGRTTHVVVESSSPSQVDAFPDDYVHSTDAQDDVREQAHLLSQLESPSSPRSPLVSQALDQEGNASPYLPRFGEQREYYKISDNVGDDEHMNAAAGATEPSISTRNNQQEVAIIGVETDTLNAKETISSVLPGDPPIHHLLDLPTNDSSLNLDGGAFSQPTTEGVSLGDQWDHVAAAHKSLEKPEEGSEISSSPSSYLSDTSPAEVGDDIAELIIPSDGFGRTGAASQDMGAVTADNDVNEFAESSALDIKSTSHHGPGSPHPSHVVDVEEGSLSLHGSEDEEDEEEDYSEDEHDERWNEDENSEGWMEDSEDDSMRLGEYSSSGSDELEIESQVSLIKPPIEIIDLEDDDEEAESVPDGLEGPYDLPVSNVSSTYLSGSVSSQILEADEGHGQDILSEDSESSQMLEADELRDEKALSVDSEPSRVLEANKDLGEDLLSEHSESSRVLEADEVRDEDALSEDSEPSQVLEIDEDRGEDVLSINSEPSQILKADKGPEEDILSVDSEPSRVLDLEVARGEDALSADSEPSQALDLDEVRGEDLPSVDIQQQQRGPYHVQKSVARITSLGLGVQFPETDTTGGQVSLVEHHIVNLLVQEPNGENYQKVEVEIKQAIDSPLPDADLTSRGHELIQESEVRHDILGPRVRNQLATPDATQRIQASSQLSSISLRSLNENQDLLTPRFTQSNSTEPLQLDASPPEQRSSLLEKLKERRTSSAKRSQMRQESEIPIVISPWFAPKRSSQVAQQSASDAKSDHSDVESDLDSDHSEDSEDSEDSEEDVDDLKEIQTGNVSISTQPLSPPTGLRTSLSYFAPLASLETHFRSTLDVLAIVITSTRVSRAKSGPRDYHVTIHLADPSTTSSNVHTTVVSIFRPFKRALPLAQAGDAILLRNFSVQRRKSRVMLLSTNSSAWAVFRTGEEAQIRGPPVEFGAAERGFVRGLKDWWGSLAAEVKEKFRKEAPKEQQLDEGKARWVDVKHELRDGTTYTDVPAEERNAIHELRDGTTYVDGDV